MLKNASSLAIVGLDTAVDGPSKVCQATNNIDAIIGTKDATGLDTVIREIREEADVAEDAWAGTG